jgi:hypothetical protein
MTDTYTVERKIRIDAPASAVYERIVDFHRWPVWSPYEELDPGMDRTYAGAESGVGAVYEWSGNLKAGAGRMEIVDAVDDERVLRSPRFRPRESGPAAGVGWPGSHHRAAPADGSAVMRDEPRLYERKQPMETAGQIQ